MDLKTASINVLNQLEVVLMQMKEEDYRQLIPSLDASIGKHIRHILEFYLCLFEGFETGEINYDYRRRDKSIETDRKVALDLIGDIKTRIEGQKGNPELVLNLKYGDITDQNIVLSTNYGRELAYNIEHTIHHLAIVKQGFKEIFQDIQLPENFGIASSTVRSMKQG